MKLFLSIILILILSASGALFGGYWYWQTELDKPLLVDQNNQIFEIKKGQSVRQVLSGMIDKGVVRHTYPLLVYIRFNHLTAKIKAGEYQLKPSMNSRQLVALWVSGKTLSHQYRITEGSTVTDALTIISGIQNIQHTLGEPISESLLLKKLNISQASLEGLLFPDTYEYKKHDSDFSLIRRSYRRMEKVLNVEWKDRAKKLPYENPYQALILASIVEKETGVAQERTQISGVFVRRLQKNMRLQTDPTVIYGLGELYQGNLTRKHLRLKTPYNTYRIKGLPPTPIALVGQEAIHAALHPDKGRSLYFVAKGDGTHQFSATLAAHNVAVRKFQVRQRRKVYRSSPANKH